MPRYGHTTMKPHLDLTLVVEARNPMGSLTCITDATALQITSGTVYLTPTKRKRTPLKEKKDLHSPVLNQHKHIDAPFTFDCRSLQMGFHERCNCFMFHLRYTGYEEESGRRFLLAQSCPMSDSQDHWNDSRYTDL